MLTMKVRLCLRLLIFQSLLSLYNSSEINVHNSSSSQVIYTYKDDTALFDDRSSNIPTSVGISGILVYPVPRNACATVQPPPNLLSDFIAFVPEYSDCAGDNDYNLQQAGYILSLIHI